MRHSNINKISKPVQHDVQTLNTDRTIEMEFRDSQSKSQTAALLLSEFQLNSAKGLAGPS